MDINLQEQGSAKLNQKERGKRITIGIKDADKLDEKLRSSIILTTEHWLEFVLIFEKLYPGYISAIKIAYPDISAAELRLAILQKLGLNYNEMSSMLGLTAAAMRKTKSRIFKKYHVLDFEQVLSI